MVIERGLMVDRSGEIINHNTQSLFGLKVLNVGVKRHLRVPDIWRMALFACIPLPQLDSCTCLYHRPLTFYRINGEAAKYLPTQGITGYHWHGAE